MQGIERRLEKMEGVLESQSSEGVTHRKDIDQELEQYRPVIEKMADRISCSPKNIAVIRETLKVIHGMGGVQRRQGVDKNED